MADQEAEVPQLEGEISQPETEAAVVDTPAEENVADVNQNQSSEVAVESEETTDDVVQQDQDEAIEKEETPLEEEKEENPLEEEKEETPLAEEKEEEKEENPEEDGAKEPLEVGGDGEGAVAEEVEAKEKTLDETEADDVTKEETPIDDPPADPKEETENVNNSNPAEEPNPTEKPTTPAPGEIEDYLKTNKKAKTDEDLEQGISSYIINEIYGSVQSYLSAEVQGEPGDGADTSSVKSEKSARTRETLSVNTIPMIRKFQEPESPPTPPVEEEERAESPKEEPPKAESPREEQAKEEPPKEEPPKEEPPKEEPPKAKPNLNLEATATVKFVLMPSGQVVTLACTLGQTLESLKSHFSTELKMAAGLIMLMFDGKNMPENTKLADLGVGPNGTIQLEMQSADPVNTPLKPYRPRQEYHMPDVITVRVTTEEGETTDVVVEIERSRVKKPFLGGFRNKNNGIEYHNASAQTMAKPRPPPPFERFCRDTQTCEQKNIRQQTTNTTGTQMTGVGIYIANAEDKLINPGKYFSADEYLEKVLKSVIVLQKYYRRWLAKRFVKKLAEDKARRLEWERKEEARKIKEKEERIKRDYARRINPKTKADFDMLIHCLEKWRQEEMERINTDLEGAERKAAMCMLLDQETELLAAIERHKNEANIDNREKRIATFLEKAAAPKKWQGHDGKMTYMDTPYTVRAKELRDIYNSINMKYLTQDERLDVLLTLKHTVKEHDCKLTQEIIELIDREADLLMRGVKEGNLTGLRKRISTLFLQYTKTPTFNPEAAKLLKVPQDPSLLRKNINYCHSCGNYKPSTEFYITSNSRHVGRCRQCQKVENDGRQREDHTYYRVMLKALRRSEEFMQDGSSICFLIQEHDIRYLVENIWGNQSILSAWDDLYDLVSVRWDKHQEWSPWNCVLLTHDEAEAHKKLHSLEEGYGAVFIHKVTQKHNFARNYFSRLPGMSELLKGKLASNDGETKTGPALASHTMPVAGAAQKV